MKVQIAIEQIDIVDAAERIDADWRARLQCCWRSSVGNACCGRNCLTVCYSVGHLHQKQYEAVAQYRASKWL
jgi:hypothetical protein